MKILDSQIIRRGLILVLFLFIVSILYVFTQPKPKTELIFLKREYTFPQAKKLCAQQKAHLPDLGLLIQLARFGLLPHPQTDYWSSFSISGFAFGWSTRKMMFSFDPHDDTDHVVCVQEK